MVNMVMPVDLQNNEQYVAAVQFWADIYKTYLTGDTNAPIAPIEEQEDGMEGMDEDDDLPPSASEMDGPTYTPTTTIDDNFRAPAPKLPLQTPGRGGGNVQGIVFFCVPVPVPWIRRRKHFVAQLGNPIVAASAASGSAKWGDGVGDTANGEFW